MWTDHRCHLAPSSCLEMHKSSSLFDQLNHLVDPLPNVD